MARILFTCAIFVVLPLQAFAGDFERGLEALKEKDFDSAVACFNAHIRENPKDAKAYHNRGKAYGHKKDYDKAIEDFSEAIRLDPKNAPAYYTIRGIAYGYKKDYDSSIRDYSKAIRLDPKDAWACNCLAWELATCPKDNLRDGKKAVELATKACEFTRWKNGSYLDTLAAAQAESGNFQEAATWQKKVIELTSSDKELMKEARQRLKLYEDNKPFRSDKK